MTIVSSALSLLSLSHKNFHKFKKFVNRFISKSHTVYLTSMCQLSCSHVSSSFRWPFTLILFMFKKTKAVIFTAKYWHLLRVAFVLVVFLSNDWHRLFDIPVTCPVCWVQSLYDRYVYWYGRDMSSSLWRSWLPYVLRHCWKHGQFCCLGNNWRRKHSPVSTNSQV